MEKIKVIFATMMLCLGILTTVSSCSDNNDEPTILAAKKIEGTYTGDMTCSVMGNESTFENMTIIITASDDVLVSVTISEFGEPPMEMPSIIIPGIKVSGSDGIYNLATTEFIGDNNGKKYSGSAQGSFADKTLTFRFNLQYGAMPMPIICSFTASQK